MNICIAGKSFIATEALLHLLDKVDDITKFYVIPNQTDLGKRNWEPSFREVAVLNNVPIIDLAQAYKIPDLIFLSLEFNKIIQPKKFTKGSRLFNIHFSKLPEYKGMYTSAWPILNREQGTGVTLHYIDEGIDTGNIIDQISFSITNDDTAFSLYMKYNEMALILIKTNFNKILTYQENAEPQQPCRASYYSKQSIDYNNLDINLYKTAYEIYSQLKAYKFRPYQMPKCYGKSVSHGVILNSKTNFPVSKIIEEDTDFFTISTIDYDLKIYIDQITEILKAAEKGDIQSLRKFHKKGYDLFEKDTNSWDAGIVAAYHGQWEALIYLLDSGYNINQKNSKGTTLLMYAASSKREIDKKEIISELIKRGASISTKDYTGKTLTQWLKERERVDLLKQLT